MIAALPLHSGSLPALANQGSLAANTSLQPSVDQASLDPATHQLGTNPQAAPNDVEAFYTVGSDPLAIDPHALKAAHAGQEGTNYTNMANLFTDSLNSIQQKGGPSDPIAMLKFQEQLIETTLNWTLYGQMASKAVSGIQSLFNNQV